MLQLEKMKKSYNLIFKKWVQHNHIFMPEKFKEMSENPSVKFNKNIPVIRACNSNK